MNDPNSIDDTDRNGLRYETSEEIVQEQTVKRINREINEEYRKKREAWRAALMVILCVGAVLGGFVVCKIMGWGE